MAGHDSEHPHRSIANIMLRNIMVEELGLEARCRTVVLAAMGTCLCAHYDLVFLLTVLYQLHRSLRRPESHQGNRRSEFEDRSMPIGRC